YASRVLPEAEGQASRMLQDAEGYSAHIIGQAQGDTARFDSIETEFSKAPAITRERLYLETMKEIMAASSKVMIDADVGNNMLYLPLDQLMNQVAGASNSGASSGSSAGANAPSTQAAAGAQ